MSVPGRRVLLALLCLPGLLLVEVLPGLAFNTTVLDLGELEGEGWSAAGLQLQINLLDDGHAHILLQAQTALLPEPLGKLSDLQLECSAAELTAARLDCRDGLLRLQSGQHGRQQIRTRFGYRFADRQLSFDLDGISLLGGRLAARGELAAGSWKIDVEANGLSLPQLSTQLSAAGLSLPRLDGSGKIGLTARLQGSAAMPESAAFSLHLQADSFTDAEGSLAGEELDVTVAGKARAITGGWRLDLELNAGACCMSSRCFWKSLRARFRQLRISITRSTPGRCCCTRLSIAIPAACCWLRTVISIWTRVPCCGNYRLNCRKVRLRQCIPPICVPGLPAPCSEPWIPQGRSMVTCTGMRVIWSGCHSTLQTCPCMTVKAALTLMV